MSKDTAKVKEAWRQRDYKVYSKAPRHVPYGTVRLVKSILPTHIEYIKYL